MYKIYINETPLLLVSSEEAKQYDPKDLKNLLVSYAHNKKNLHRYIDNLEKGANYQSIIIHSADVEQLREDFFSRFKIRQAGGGVVFNESGKILAIYRGGYWDLPKGKTEKGETMEETAIREVQEETGVENITLDKFITHTYHTFKNRKGKRVLKWSTWYTMHTSDTELTPQAEEDIELAVFLDKDELLTKMPIYKNILEVLNQL
ncbi:MAG: NUDIX domain-containing protein [Aureispira sp.]|nr:NUDIX domain-containing protein [Aureispira sp.]